MPQSRRTPVGQRTTPDPSGAQLGDRSQRGRPASRASDEGRGPDRLHLALMPLRIFLGVTLLYAGLDKILDPAFLHASGPGSIGQQLEAFTHVSPLTPLIQLFAQPFPVLTGTVVALAEIAIGLGTLSGLLFRVSAVAGFALSIVFWLTASWSTTPYFYGPDLPYAFGWLTLALAGHGGLYTIGPWLERLINPPAARAGRFAPAEASAERRLLLQAMALGAAAIAIGGVAGIGGRFLSRGSGRVAGGDGAIAPGAAGGPTALGPGTAGAAGTPSPAGVPGTTPTPGPTAVSGTSGEILTTLDKIQPRHAYGFQDPTTGDPAVLIRLANDQVVAYDALCTHEGCTVGYDRASGLLLCPCHGAVFDPTNGGQAVQGPTNIPLTSLPLTIDKATGTITLRA